ncbi:MAG: undecaprenyl-diphosphate phosphatase [Rhodospirillales bacterium]|nr:undecaprenyl-diphosphate phosphatase [Rhodospirillales bacterium]
MTLLHIVILSLFQGIVEFLPISSWGHLVLLKELAHWPDHGLVMEVAVHVGSLGAVVVYFRRDLWAMVLGVVRATRGRPDPGTRLAALMVVGTIPVVVAGFAVDRIFGDSLRTLEVVAWTTFVFAIVLYVTDRRGMTVRRLEHMAYGDAIVIGLAQTLALVPGTSRSGITMSAARMLGIERPDAARFSMLLAVPAILGAGVLKSAELVGSDAAALTLASFIAAALAFAAALIAITALMAWLRRAGFTPFVVYRLILGAGLLVLAYAT